MPHLLAALHHGNGAVAVRCWWAARSRLALRWAERQLTWSAVSTSLSYCCGRNLVGVAAEHRHRDDGRDKDEPDQGGVHEQVLAVEADPPAK
jgi:hypothetical protein